MLCNSVWNPRRENSADSVSPLRMVTDSNVPFSSTSLATTPDLESILVNEAVVTVVSCGCAGAVASKESCDGNAIISFLLETRLDVSTVSFWSSGVFRLTEAMTTPVRMIIISASKGITAGRWPSRFLNRGFRL